VIHRDLKPQNILVAKDGTPYLTDFGLAREVTASGSLTISGQILGTPAFMSPEQARGGKTPVDSRSDLYSLGVVLYALLAARLPFHEESIYDLLDSIIRRPPPPPGGPPALAAVALRCLEKDPGRRYATAEELAADLERALQGPAAAPPKRSRARLAVAALALLLVAPLAWMLRPPKPPAPGPATPPPPTVPSAAPTLDGWEVLPAPQRASTPFVARADAGGFRLRNAQVRALAATQGDRRLTLRALPTSTGGLVALSLGGYRLHRSAGELILLGPDLAELWRGKADDPSIGLALELSAVTVLSGGKTAHRRVIPAGAPVLRPWYGALQDGEAVFSDVTLSGAPAVIQTPDPKETARLLGEVGRAFPLGPAEDLLAGSGAGRFRVHEKGTVERKDGELRAVSEPGKRVELHGPNARTSRLRFRYRVHDAKSIVLRVRAGTREVNFHLPVDEPGRWRSVDAVALEGLHAVTIDGAWRLASAEDDPSETLDGLLRISVRDGAASFKDCTLETISGMPEEPLWTSALPAEPPAGWERKDGHWVGSGKLLLRQPAPHFDLEVLAVAKKGARLELAKNNRQVFLSEAHPADGEMLGFSLQVRTFQVTYLETWLFDEVRRGRVTTTLDKGPLELIVRDGPVRIAAVRTRAR
jgi:hypothetical protein